MAERVGVLGFMPAGNRRTGKAYLCKNGDAYGIGMLGRLFTTSTPTVTASGQNHPPIDRIRTTTSCDHGCA